jgi:predicted SAM-dependent methyltransferase
MKLTKQNLIAIHNSGFFDAEWYLEAYPDIKEAGVNPLVHYCRFGWKEGRNPSRIFSSQNYFETHPEVKKLNINPLLHYILSGQNIDLLDLPFAKPYKLHLGCGTNYREGWVNVDSSEYSAGTKFDIDMDLTKRLPFENDSVSFITNEHFLEHINRYNGLAFLAECYRVLIPNGVLRISTPSLEHAVDVYIKKNFSQLDSFHRNQIQVIANTPCQFLNKTFHSWGHQFIYDREELILSLTTVGFNKQDIQEQEYGKSKFAELHNIETRPEGMFFEAIK